jgi:hypothetical protein
MRRHALQILSIPLAGYVCAVGYLMVRETSLVYLPADRTVSPPAEALALRQREVIFRASDGIRLAAWIVPAARDSLGVWLLVCHGNYGNVAYGPRPDFYASARDAGFNVFAFDYRGFGASEGRPSESGVYDDAESAYRYLRDSLAVPSDHILIFGHSLGSGVAIELATRVPAAGLVVEGAYTSVPDRGQELYPFMPVRFMARNRFASISKVGRITMPKLFLHSPSDDIIPIAHGRRLFAAAAAPKRFVEVVGGHMEAYQADREKYFGAIIELARSAIAGTSESPSTVKR